MWNTVCDVKWIRNSGTNAAVSKKVTCIISRSLCTCTQQHLHTHTAAAFSGEKRNNCSFFHFFPGDMSCWSGWVVYPQKRQRAVWGYEGFWVLVCSVQQIHVHSYSSPIVCLCILYLCIINLDLWVREENNIPKSKDLLHGCYWYWERRVNLNIDRSESKSICSTVWESPVRTAVVSL